MRIEQFHKSIVEELIEYDNLYKNTCYKGKKNPHNLTDEQLWIAHLIWQEKKK